MARSKNHEGLYYSVFSGPLFTFSLTRENISLGIYSSLNVTANFRIIMKQKAK